MDKRLPVPFDLERSVPRYIDEGFLVRPATLEEQADVENSGAKSLKDMYEDSIATVKAFDEAHKGEEPDAETSIQRTMLGLKLRHARRQYFLGGKTMDQALGWDSDGETDLAES